jgi:hypothetical protein
MFAGKYYKDGKLTEEDKYNFNKVLKVYVDTYKIKLKEKNPENILKEMKVRIDTAMEMYKKILEAENKISSYFKEIEKSKILEEENNNANSSKILIKLFFKHSLNYLQKNNINNEVKTQIELALKLLENNEFDCSLINIFNINSEVTKSLRILRDNLIYIRTKSILYKNFKKFKKLILGYEELKEYMENKYEVNKGIFKSYFNELQEGI